MSGELVLAIPIIYAIQKWACRNDPPPKKKTNGAQPPPIVAQPHDSNQPVTGQPQRSETQPTRQNGDFITIGDEVFELKKIGRR